MGGKIGGILIGSGILICGTSGGCLSTAMSGPQSDGLINLIVVVFCGPMFVGGIIAILFGCYFLLKEQDEPRTPNNSYEEGDEP